MPEKQGDQNDSIKLLEKPLFAKFLETHQGAVDEVTRAAKILNDKPDRDAALKKLLPTLSKKVINVFFSYKKKANDVETANEIIKILRQLSADKLNITHQGEFEKGIKWREAIKQGVKSANWFILLLPDPSDDWDWCLFETGLFVAQATSADRLICLHHPNIARPSEISEFNSVPATQEDIEKFLKMALVDDNPVSGLPAVNKAVEDNIPEYATKIVNAIRPPSQSLYKEIFEPYVELRIPKPDKLTSIDDMDGATIVSSNKDALLIFDYKDQPKTWGKLHSTVSEKTSDQRWREELFHVVRKVGGGRNFFPVQAVFHGKNGKIYKPVVNAICRRGKSGDIETFCIIFAEEVGALDDRETPKNLALMGYMLRYTFRFRWEILEKFTQRPLDVDDIQRLDNALRRIKVDSESRGFTDPKALIDLFPEEKKARVGEMFQDWFKARNPEGTGTLDIAIREEDPVQAQAILKEFIPINQEFLEMTSKILTKLIENTAAEN